MKYTLVNSNTPNSMRLQSIGFVLGTPASNIKKGDFLMWNFGSKSEVIDILSETRATITIAEKCSSGGVYERKMTKKRLVCILSKD